jgi:hypothetical protein
MTVEGNMVRGVSFFEFTTNTYMKHFLLAFILLSAANGASGQNVQLSTDVPKSMPTREMGIFGQGGEGSGDASLGMVGLQYKHWHNERVGFRIIGAYGNYHAMGPDRIYTSGDTVVTRRQHINVNLPIVGFGVEAQRHFYKRIYLFAALELKGGYGSGTADSSLTASVGYNNPPYQYGRYSDARDVNLTMVSFTASIGAKVQFNRINVGAEILPLRMQYTNMSGDVQNGGLLDFGMWGMSNRLFLSYRF